MISWEDFEKIDIRSGTITAVELFRAARNPSYKLTIDFGGSGIRRSSAQITHHYAPADLVGKQVLAVMNFPPKNIAGFMSECLVLGVYDEVGKVILLHPGKDVPNGSKVG